jgi:hypothetical protein
LWGNCCWCVRQEYPKQSRWTAGRSGAKETLVATSRRKGWERLVLGEGGDVCDAVCAVLQTPGATQGPPFVHGEGHDAGSLDRHWVGLRRRWRRWGGGVAGAPGWEGLRPACTSPARRCCTTTPTAFPPVLLAHIECESCMGLMVGDDGTRPYDPTPTAPKPAPAAAPAPPWRGCAGGGGGGMDRGTYSPPAKCTASPGHATEQDRRA